VSADRRFADDGVARNVAMPEPRPLTPDPTGRPVQFVSVPDDGVPSTGVTSVGEVANTSAPDPVSSEITPANCADVVAANCDNGLAVNASPPPGMASQAPLPFKNLVASPDAGAGTRPLVPPDPASPTNALRIAVASAADRFV